eukprot:CAMPEP_0204292244 /NCGR_PEP_ID=MMETSP0468-20130131/63967_1 /ASSEMBLY_ACC=CAM_ASM_000383 /TAXON_ID=2969 /ORGANISM="Oxyrrhis marina" /LENGTH=88 /DNA_ID=CAMNT_0051270615 /DNA_START=306 /DNA_END=568 /DNA_ORIENTATION=-
MTPFQHPCHAEEGNDYKAVATGSPGEILDQKQLCAGGGAADRDPEAPTYPLAVPFAVLLGDDGPVTLEPPQPARTTPLPPCRLTGSDL